MTTAPLGAPSGVPAELTSWAQPRLATLLPSLEDEAHRQIISYAASLAPDAGAIRRYLTELLGDNDAATAFANGFTELALSPTGSSGDSGAAGQKKAAEAKIVEAQGAPPGYGQATGAASSSGAQAPPPKQSYAQSVPLMKGAGYTPPTGTPPQNGASRVASRNHTNCVVEAARARARDEQEMQQLLVNLRYQYNIYNDDIEPEHETDYYCNCAIHQYRRRKALRYPVQDKWSQAVMYPGEKAYNDNPFNPGLFSGNPYRMGVVSPYGLNAGSSWVQPRPSPMWHQQSISQTINLNNRLNREAESKIAANEPKHSIWDDGDLDTVMRSLSLGNKKGKAGTSDEKRQLECGASSSDPSASTAAPAKKSKLANFRKSIGILSSDERAVVKAQRVSDKGRSLRDAIEAEERGRWPDDAWRELVAAYQNKVGMTYKIADLRARAPTQYLHLLRAGYFEPIPVAWANQASNPLKFTIEAAAGWRGITPAWRGFEDTAEERLYWVLNHREGSVGMRMKPDFISEMNMALARMATAVEPPPSYFAADDTCHLQHTSDGYSKQVMPRPLVVFDRPETPTDDTMILLDVSGSMNFDPIRPRYDRYLITGYDHSTQPKNKDVARAIIRRFTDAMANHDHQFQGYDLTTFSDRANYIGTINHRNLDAMWKRVRIGGGTRVMTGWQKVKELHFQKHAASATHHPVYGWQAGPETPMLRLLLLLDGEATDMDEFELDLLGLSWAHVTIFLIGVDGCPHHHRHANELQRISDVNHHVSFVDAQGNTPERFVTHELLKRHLGYELSMQEFEQLEELPPYSG